ncbi:MAG: CDP-glucose 4,6-dehydratase [Candidatus Omnitrophica bacterium]|nr:CDP-glucose 4,6-dehydratase [Candidatus Omnitrophota bacterium]
MFGNYYSKKRILLTGHTGFKGSWLGLWLKHLGAEVCGVGFEAPTVPSFYELLGSSVFEHEVKGDIRSAKTVERALNEGQPDLVFHLAAQSLVRRSYEEPLETFETNALGTAQLLEVIRRRGLPCAIVVVTSDKCYENQPEHPPYGESDALGGHDVYSASKAASELVVQAWRRSFFIPNADLGNLASARAGNVIGGGDYAQDRIVPDCIRALLANRPIPVRQPRATRPWQHVLDCLSGYLWLGSCLAQAGKDSPLAAPFNFGPDPNANRSVGELVDEILRLWPGEWQDASDPQAPHEAGQLNLSLEKANRVLQWFPTWDFPEAVRRTIDWYRKRHLDRSPDMIGFSLDQIEAYTTAARQKRNAWALDVER